MRVEFRYLYFVPSHVGDDRLTIALLHWDGDRLRLAHSVERISGPLSSHRGALERELSALEQRVRDSHPKPGVGLDDALRVTTGRGPSLLWSPVRVGQTEDAEAHFEDLRSQLGLIIPRDSMRRAADESIVQTLKNL